MSAQVLDQLWLLLLLLLFLLRLCGLRIAAAAPLPRHPGTQ